MSGEILMVADLYVCKHDAAGMECDCCDRDYMREYEMKFEIPEEPPQFFIPKKPRRSGQKQNRWDQR